MLDVSTWHLVFCGARTLIGRLGSKNHVGVYPDTPPDTISPVFQLVRDLSPDPRQPGVMTLVHPVNWYPIESLPMPDGATTYPVASLPSEDRRALAQSCANAEKMIQQMKLAGSGIQIAKTMPKVP